MFQFQSYQLAIALGIVWVCLYTTEAAVGLHVPARNYHPGFNHSRPAYQASYNHSRPAVVHQPNTGYHNNNYYPNQPQPNIGFGYNPNTVFGSNGYRPANQTAVQGGYRPHNSTSIFHRLFKFW